MTKRALVTGGAHRVGKTLALALADRGCNVVVHFHSSAAQAETTVQQIRSAGVGGYALQADLGQPQGVFDLYRAFDELAVPLDILVQSAAIMEASTLLDASVEEWQRTIDLNLRGAFFTLQGAARRMQDQGGVIINISDVAGLKPWERYPIHSISKSGVEMLTRVAALALAPTIRVNAIAPGPVLKPARMRDERWSEIGRALPLGRTGTAQDVAQAVLFLIENDFVTGETLVVDGGDHLA